MESLVHTIPRATGSHFTKKYTENGALDGVKKPYILNETKLYEDTNGSFATQIKFQGRSDNKGRAKPVNNVVSSNFPLNGQISTLSIPHLNSSKIITPPNNLSEFSKIHFPILQTQSNKPLLSSRQQPPPPYIPLIRNPEIKPEVLFGNSLKYLFHSFKLNHDIKEYDPYKPYKTKYRNKYHKVLVKKFFIPRYSRLTNFVNEVYKYISLSNDRFPVLIRDISFEPTPKGDSMGEGYILFAITEIVTCDYDKTKPIDNISALPKVIQDTTKSLIFQVKSFHEVTQTGHTQIHPAKIITSSNYSLSIGNFIDKISFIKIFDGLRPGTTRPMGDANELREFIDETTYFSRKYLSNELKGYLNKAKELYTEFIEHQPKTSLTEAINQLNEMISRNVPSDYTMKSGDVFATGAIIVNYIEKLFGYNDEKIKYDNVDQVERFLKENSFCYLFRDLIKRMLSYPRLTIFQCNCHPYLWTGNEIETYLANVLDQLLWPAATGCNSMEVIWDKNEYFSSFKESCTDASVYYDKYPYLKDIYKKFISLPDQVSNRSKVCPKIQNFVQFLVALKKDVVKSSGFGIFVLLCYGSTLGDRSNSDIRNLAYKIFEELPSLFLESLDLFLFPKVVESNFETRSTNKLFFFRSINKIRNRLNHQIFQISGKEAVNENGVHNMTTHSNGYPTIQPDNCFETIKEIAPKLEDSSTEESANDAHVSGESLPDELANVAEKLQIYNEQSDLQEIDSKYSHAIADWNLCISAVPPPYNEKKERQLRKVIKNSAPMLPKGTVPDHLKWYADVNDEFFEAWLKRLAYLHVKDKMAPLDQLSSMKTYNKETILHTTTDPILNTIQQNKHNTTNSYDENSKDTSRCYSINFLARGLLLYRHFYEQLVINRTTRK